MHCVGRFTPPALRVQLHFHAQELGTLIMWKQQCHAWRTLCILSCGSLSCLCKASKQIALERGSAFVVLAPRHHETKGSRSCRGKRTGVFGAFLLAIYDDDAEEYQAISKIGTGFSEVLLKELADSLREHIIDSPRPYYKCAHLKCPQQQLVLLG